MPAGIDSSGQDLSLHTVQLRCCADQVAYSLGETGLQEWICGWVGGVFGDVTVLCLCCDRAVIVLCLVSDAWVDCLWPGQVVFLRHT